MLSFFFWSTRPLRWGDRQSSASGVYSTVVGVQGLGGGGAEHYTP